LAAYDMLNREKELRMSFLSVLGAALHIGEAVAPSVATAINPAAGALVGLVIHAVTEAEQTGGTGPQKREAALQAVLPAATGVVNAVLQAKGASASVNSTQLSTAVGVLIDGTVALLNSIQHTGAAAAAATGAAPSAPATPAGT
jgi:molybdopterin biosynthesis enzyme MoaB